MKISRAIVATNDNPNYFEFWPIVAQAWRNFDIEPTLAVVGCISLDHSRGTIFKIPEIVEIPSGFITQVIRFIIPCFFPDEVCVIGDIDMIPLSKAYFTNDIAALDDNGIIIFSADAYGNAVRYPMCYIAAKGKYFQQVIGLKDTSLGTITSFIKHLYSLGLGWDTDELFFAKCLHAQPELFAKAILLKRGGWRPFAKDRIDRDKWRYNLFRLFSNQYIDAHCLRPLHNYEKKLSPIIDYVNAKADGQKFLIYRLKKAARGIIDVFWVMHQRHIGIKFFNVDRDLPTSMQKDKVISFSLYGYTDRYAGSLEQVIRSYQDIYIDWECRVYVGNDVSNKILCLLKELLCHVVVMDVGGIDSRFTLWRFLAMQDKNLTAILFRDLDSMASTRESEMVSHWLQSSKRFHIIRDHPSHGSRIMAGMCGIKANHFDFLKEVSKILIKDQYGIDQLFLENVIYPQVREDALIHDSYPRFPDESVVVMPFKGQESFVGEISTDDALKQAGRTYKQACHTSVNL